MSANIGRQKEIEISEAMIIEGIRELHADRDFEHDWQVVSRIYAAMRAAQLQKRK